MITLKPKHAAILIAGMTEEQLLALPDDCADLLIFTGEPVVFDAGSAQILGSFKHTKDRLTIELAHIEGGGEGVLKSISRLVERYAKQRGFQEVEWIVHAVTCARPNLKLRRVLERSGFEIRQLETGAPVFYLQMDIGHREKGRASA